MMIGQSPCDARVNSDVIEIPAALGVQRLLINRVDWTCSGTVN